MYVHACVYKEMLLFSKRLRQSWGEGGQPAAEGTTTACCCTRPLLPPRTRNKRTGAYLAELALADAILCEGRLRFESLCRAHPHDAAHRRFSVRGTAQA